MALTKKEYNYFMNENWADKLYGKSYKDLNAAGKKMVAKAVANDVEHNDKDAKKMKKEHPTLYKRGLEDGKRTCK